MRLMSFSLTTAQFLDGTKTVTRRLGWLRMKPGDRLWAVQKAMGLKKGEHPQRLGIIEIVSVRRELLSDIDDADCVREGFPELDRIQFCDMFRRAHGMKQENPIVTRIEFRRVDGQQTVRLCRCPACDRVHQPNLQSCADRRLPAPHGCCPDCGSPLSPANVRPLY